MIPKLFLLASSILTAFIHATWILIALSTPYALIQLKPKMNLVRKVNLGYVNAKVVFMVMAAHARISMNAPQI